MYLPRTQHPRLPQFLLCLPLVVILPLALSACDMTGPGDEDVIPAGEVPLEKIEFLRAETLPGEPLLAMAWIHHTNLVETVEVQVASRSGARRTLTLTPYALRWGWLEGGFGEPWKSMSEVELAALLGAADWVAAIGVMEEGAIREPGFIPPYEVSDETVESFMAWLEEQGATEVQRQDPRFGYLTARLPVDLDLIRRIRAHPNVETLESTYMLVKDDWTPEPYLSSEPYIGILVTNDGSGLSVQPGDELTLRYRQPDGSLLEATIPVVAGT
jgi:hypothetical protein